MGACKQLHPSQLPGHFCGGKALLTAEGEAGASTSLDPLAKARSKQNGNLPSPSRCVLGPLLQGRQCLKMCPAKKCPKQRLPPKPLLSRASSIYWDWERKCNVSGGASSSSVSWSPVFHVRGGAVPRIHQLGPRGPEEKHTPFGGPQSLDLTGAWDTGGISRNPISAPPHSTYHRTGHVHLLLSAASEG